MRRKIDSLLMAAGLAAATLLPIPAAAQAGAQQHARARLEHRAASIDSELGQKTGGMQRTELRRQRQEIDEAIKQLQAGRNVSAEEIDRILGEVTVERSR